MDVVGVQSYSMQISFKVGGMTPHSGVASNERSKDGSGKFLTFFNLKFTNVITSIMLQYNFDFKDKVGLFKTYL